MRDFATYLQPVQQGVVGDDPLGLAPTNERLYNAAFPGFNNYVRYIRVYAALCWMAAQVESALEAGSAKTNEDARRLFKSAFEKIELALVWANKEQPALAGAQRQFPATDEKIEFLFPSFGPSQASLFAAVTYQPSLVNGLGFLEAKSSRTYACLPAGVRLAKAFDEVVSGNDRYDWLKSPVKLIGKGSFVTEDLFDELDVRNPSAGEQEAFLESFFPASLQQDSRNDDRARWLTLNLMLSSIDAVCRANAGEGTWASIEEVRACMARGTSVTGDSVLSKPVERVQAWWSILQVRQLQRYCLETLYCVVERWIDARRGDAAEASLTQCCSDLAASALEPLWPPLRESVGQACDFYRSKQAGYASLYEAAAAWEAQEEDEENDADVFFHMSNLNNEAGLEINGASGSEAVANAYVGLIFCALETVNLQSNPVFLETLKADGDACSLLALASLVERSRDQSVEAFIQRVVKDWVVLRHFSVATTRSLRGDGKNRFRFVMGDQGLERFEWTATLPKPAMSADKLRHAMLLCQQGGLLQERDEMYRLSKAGRQRLKLFES